MIEFTLPDELIAQEPASPRDHARMLVFDRKTKTITDDYFYNVLNYLPDPTCVVVNNSKVEHCRMLFDEGKKEIFILEKANNKTVRALVRSGKVFRLNKNVQLTSAVSAVVTAIDEDGIRTIEFSKPLDHPDLVAAEHVPSPTCSVISAQSRNFLTVLVNSGVKCSPAVGAALLPKVFA